MSAAATAAGYLYATGRFNARKALEGEMNAQQKAPEGEAAPTAPLRAAPKIQYRRRRWKPAPEGA